MNAFRFKLQRVLDAKDAHEQAVQIRLAELQRQELACRHQLADLQKLLRTALADQESLGKAPADGVEWMRHIRYQNRLERRVHETGQRLANLGLAVERVRNELLACMRERKGLERLKGQAQEAWAHAYRKEEARVMDEVALMRFTRARGAA